MRTLRLSSRFMLTTAGTEHGRATLTSRPLEPEVEHLSWPLAHWLSRQRRGGESPLPAMRQFMYGRAGTHVEDQVLE